MITTTDYFMGRDARYPGECTDEIRANAQRLVDRVNLILTMAAVDGVYPGIDETTGTPVASGWRPPAVNGCTPNAAPGSKHMTGHGLDVRERQERALARWCLRNLDRLADAGLWIEDPQWTPTWVHFQDVPPKSGRRVFIPSSKPPLAAKLPEQVEA